MNKTFKILEIVWLVMGCVGVLMTAYSLFEGDKSGAIYFLVFTLVSGLMFYVRKKQRIRFETNQAKQKSTTVGK